MGYPGGTYILFVKSRMEPACHPSAGKPAGRNNTYDPLTHPGFPAA